MTYILPIYVGWVWPSIFFILWTIYRPRNFFFTRAIYRTRRTPALMRAASTAPPYPPFFPFSYTTPALLAATYTFFNDRHYKERAPLYICSESFTRARAPVIDCSLYITHIEWGRRRRRHCTLCDVTPRVLATSPHAYIHRHTLHVHKYIHIGIYTHTHTHIYGRRIVRSFSLRIYAHEACRARKVYARDYIYRKRERAEAKYVDANEIRRAIPAMPLSWRSNCN